MSSSRKDFSGCSTALWADYPYSTQYSQQQKKNTEKYSMCIAIVMCRMCEYRSDNSSVPGEQAQYVARFVSTS